MIQGVWNKKVVIIIQIDPKDVADQSSPLPLILQIPWNHYLAFYYDQIIAFFSSYALYPWNKNQLHLTLDSHNLTLNGTQIVGHLLTIFKEGIEKPLQLTCHFRNKLPLQIIQIKKFFKYNLKASTAIRNQKFGASILTLQMSIQNFDKLFESFKNNDFNAYKGSNNFGSQNLGFSFIESKTQRVPVKIISKEFIIERGAKKQISLSELLACIFQEANFQQHTSKQKQNQAQKQKQNQNQQSKKSEMEKQQNNKKQVESATKQNQKQERIKKGLKFNYLFQKYRFYLHGIKLNRGQYSMEFFQRFCHPDGFLYLFFQDSN